jgi:hypothetical protein
MTGRYIALVVRQLILSHAWSHLGLLSASSQAVMAARCQSVDLVQQLLWKGNSRRGREDKAHIERTDRMRGPSRSRPKSCFLSYQSNLARSLEGLGHLKHRLRLDSATTNASVLLSEIERAKSTSVSPRRTSSQAQMVKRGARVVTHWL